MNNKIAIICLSSIFAFSACFGGSDENSDGSSSDLGSMNQYATSEFSINFPKDWVVKEQADFPSNVPVNTIVNFQSDLKNERFTANVNLSATTVPEGISSKDFALSTIAKAKNSLLNYSEISREEISQQINDELSLESYKIQFSGKKSSIENLVQFSQIYYVLNNKAFVVTGAHLPDEEESIVNSVDEMLNSFALL